MTSRLGKWMALITLGVGGIPAGALANDHEQPVTMQELPSAVRSTLDKEAQGGRIGELRKETKSDGRVQYEAEILKGTEKTDLEIAPDGKVLERETHSEKHDHD